MEVNVTIIVITLKCKQLYDIN